MEKYDLIRIMDIHVDYPQEKLVKLIAEPAFVAWLWKSLRSYCIQHTQENHEEMIKVVSKRLTGTDDMELDWSQKEFNTFVKYEEGVVV